MATITVNLDDKTEERFRKNAKMKFGKKKGALGAALAEALNKWNSEQVDLECTMKLLEKSTDRGGYKYASREELHTRN